jgi:hypothetical protein
MAESGASTAAHISAFPFTGVKVNLTRTGRSSFTGHMRSNTRRLPPPSVKMSRRGSTITLSTAKLNTRCPAAERQVSSCRRLSRAMMGCSSSPRGGWVVER